MPQEFQVLQCYSCHTFQVHQVKKTTKWACKMCGEKQSLKKVFGRGSGAECRQHVQKLNTVRGEMDQNAQTLREQSYVASDHLIAEQDQINIDNLHRHEIHFQEKRPRQLNKWKTFVEDDVSLSSNLDDDDDDDDYRYTTDAVKFKQGRKRKRESKGGNYCRNRSEKWTEFSGSTNTGLYGNSSTYNIEQESGLNELPSSSDSWLCQSSSCAENNNEVYNQDSSLWRNKWNTYDDKFSSQESFSDSVNENFAKRIKSETHSTILSQVQGDSVWMKGNDIVKSTKWSSYTEGDISSQESQTDNLEGVPETFTDSRLCVTFDPSQDKNSTFFKGCHEESVSVSQKSEEDTQGRERNEFKIAERNNTKFSKWTGFISSAEEWNQSDSEQDEEDSNARKQNYSKWTSSDVLDKPERQKFSKWTEYTEDEKSSKKEQEENCQHLTCTSVKKNPALSDDNNSVQKQNPLQHFFSSRHLKSIGTLCNSGRLTNKVKVKPLFTTDDLDDTDLEL